MTDYALGLCGWLLLITLMLLVQLRKLKGLGPAARRGQLGPAETAESHGGCDRGEQPNQSLEAAGEKSDSYDRQQLHLAGL